LLQDHGPKFSGKGKKTSAKASGASSQQNDQSRSAKAFRAGATLKAGGASYEEMRDGLLQHEDLDIVKSASEKGLFNGERELQPESLESLDTKHRRHFALRRTGQKMATSTMLGQKSHSVSFRVPI
jgi:hypothetical protein